MSNGISAKIDRRVTDARATAPATRAVAVTPAVTVDGTFPMPGATLWVGVAGNLNVVPWANDTDAGVLFKGVAAGPFPVRVRHVLSGSTTATDIVAKW